jgi:alkylation response protein AidB-like acyl-CoA dehydrogenase
LAHKELSVEFELDKSQKEIQKAVRDFCRGQFEKDSILEAIGERKFPSKIWKKAAQLGFSGIHIPENLGGGGMGLFEYVLAAEEMCRKDSSAGMALMLAGLGCEAIFRFGDQQLAEKYLPPVASGKKRAAAALFGPSAGQDISVTGTGAKEKSGNWIINGTKAYVPNGAGADFYVVLCGHDQGGAEPYKDNLFLIVVDRDAEGINIEPAGPTLGANLMDFAHVTFENVSVPQSNQIDKPGSGMNHSAQFLNEARIQVAALALGTARGAFDRASDYVRQRRQFGKRLAEFQITRHKLADMAQHIDLAACIVYQAAAAFDSNKCDAKTAASAKLAATAAALAVTDEAVQLLGGYGYMTEYEVEHFYRDAKTLEIFLGTPAVLKEIIAGAVIGRLK